MYAETKLANDSKRNTEAHPIPLHNMTSKRIYHGFLNRVFIAF